MFKGMPAADTIRLELSMLLGIKLLYEFYLLVLFSAPGYPGGINSYSPVISQLANK